MSTPGEKISQLPAASAQVGSELIPEVQSGQTVNTTPAAILAYLAANLPGLPVIPTTKLSGLLQAAQEPAHTGDVTNSAGSLALSIGTNAVNNVQFAKMAANTLKGNNTGSTANAADLTVAQVNTLLGSAIGFGVINPKAAPYSAVGNGIANDTTAVQAAMTAAAAGPYPIFFPAGTYLVDTLTLTAMANNASWSFRGAGQQATIFKSLSGNTVITFNPASSHLRGAFSNFSVVGTGSGSGHGIYLGPSGSYGMFNTVWENIDIESCGGVGFYESLAGFGFSCTYRNINVTNCLGHQFDVYSGNTVLLDRCYAQICPTPGTAGYRIHGQCQMNSCNGIDGGDYWGIFGNSVALGDADNNYGIVTMINCNIEDFSVAGIRSRFNTPILLNCNFTSAGAGVATVGTLTGTATSGTYTNVPLTGGTGTGAKATVVVTAGSVASVTITNVGTGPYTVADALSFTVTGGSGTCAVATLSTVYATTCESQSTLKSMWLQSTAGLQTRAAWTNGVPFAANNVVPFELFIKGSDETNNSYSYYDTGDNHVTTVAGLSMAYVASYTNALYASLFKADTLYAGVGGLVVVPYAAGNTSTAPAPNCANGLLQTWTQNGNVTWGAPTNAPQIGQTLTLAVTKDATAGSYTTAFNGIYRNAPTIAATGVTASTKATFNFQYDGTSWQYIGGSTAFA